MNIIKNVLKKKLYNFSTLKSQKNMKQLNIISAQGPFIYT